MFLLRYIVKLTHHPGLRSVLILTGSGGLVSGNLSSTVDFDKPLPLWYWILMVAVLFSLIRAIASGLNGEVPMSRTSRFIRVVLGSLWAVMIVLGMALNIWKAYR
jgi:hypothetical protein